MRIGKFIKKPRNNKYNKFSKDIIGKQCLEVSRFTNNWNTHKSNVILKDFTNLVVPTNNIEFESDDKLTDIEIKKLFLNAKWKNAYQNYIENNYFPLVGTVEAVSGNWSSPTSLLIKFTNVIESKWISISLLPINLNNLQYEKGVAYTFMIPAWLYKKIKNS